MIDKEIKTMKKYPVAISRKLVKKRNNKNGKLYWIVKISETKEIFVPYEWLKLSPNGRFYKGRFQKDHMFMGRQSNTYKVKASELEGIFPSKYSMDG